MDNSMDKLDSQVVAALRRDARMPLSSMAQDLGITRTTLRTRIARLQESGEIVGFTVLTRADVAQDPVRGIMTIGIEGRGTERIMRQLGTMAEVRAVHSTNGRWDVIIEIGTETLEEFDTALFRIRRLDGIVASETNLLLKTRRAG